MSRDFSLRPDHPNYSPVRQGDEGPPHTALELQNELAGARQRIEDLQKQLSDAALAREHTHAQRVSIVGESLARHTGYDPTLALQTAENIVRDLETAP